jgi:hypothetical protein
LHSEQVATSVGQLVKVGSIHGGPSGAVRGEVNIFALFLDTVDLFLVSVVLNILVVDELLDALDVLLEVSPGDLLDLTAWVVVLALLELLPTIVNENLGLGDGGLNVSLEAVHELVPLLVNNLGDSLLDLITACGTLSAGIEEVTVLGLLIVPCSNLNEVSELVDGGAGGVSEPGINLGVDTINVGIEVRLSGDLGVELSEGLGVVVSDNNWGVNDSGLNLLISNLFDSEGGANAGSEDDTAPNSDRWTLTCLMAASMRTILASALSPASPDPASTEMLLPGSNAVTPATAVTASTCANVSLIPSSST